MEPITTLKPLTESTVNGIQLLLPFKKKKKHKLSFGKSNFTQDNYHEEQ